MSTFAVQQALDQMEAWLADPEWDPDPDALAVWDEGFKSAMKETEGAPDRVPLIERSHRLGKALEARTSRFVEIRDALRVELDAQNLGNRALRGYQSTFLKT